MTFLLIAGYPDSLLNFRGPLIDALISCGLSVHVAAPDLDSDSAIRKQLKAKGAHVHDIPLRRTGMNPVMDLLALASLWRLMRHIRPDYVLGYTIKPVIYGSLAVWPVAGGQGGAGLCRRSSLGDVTLSTGGIRISGWGF